MKVYKAADMHAHWFTFDDTHVCYRKDCNVLTHKVIALTHGNVVFAFRLCRACQQYYTILFFVGDGGWSAKFFDKR
jgi:hypothetical protein